MIRRSILGLALLMLATSCVQPPRDTGASASAMVRVLIPEPARRPAAPLALEGPSAALLAEAPEPTAEDLLTVTPALPFVEHAAPAVAQRALDCLTAAVYYEARSQSTEGQQAVAQVVLNRVRSPAFPNSVCGTVYEGSRRKTGCQFSFTCDGSMAARREPSAWARSVQVAQAALAGSVYAPVGTATYFHTTAINPWWASKVTKITTVGAHVFYRLPGSWGELGAFNQRYAGIEPTITPGSLIPARPVDEIIRVIEAGVRVHRGNADSWTATEESRPPPVTSAFGVRIHRSTTQPAGPATVSTRAAPHGVTLHVGDVTPAPDGAL